MMSSSYSTFPNEDEADGGIAQPLHSSQFSPESEAIAEEELPFESSSSSAPTKSQIIFVKFVFYMLGCGFLLPWNSFIAAESYFLSRFIQSCPSSEYDETGLVIAVNKELSNDSSNNDKEDGSDFMSWLGLFYNLSGVIALMFLLLKSYNTRDMNKSIHHHHHHKTQQEELESFLSSTDNQGDTTNDTTISNRENKIHKRSQQCNVIVTTLVIFLIIMIITSIFVLIPSFNNSPTSIQCFKILTFICIIICGTNGAFISANIVSYANMYFPPLYSIQCYVSGQALGGMAISILNLSLDYFVDGKNEDIFWKEHCGNETIVFSDRQLYATTIHEEHNSSLSLHIGSLLSCHDYRNDWGAFSYFVTSCVFLILCIGLFIMLDSSSIFEYYRNQRMMAFTITEDNTNSINHQSRNDNGTTTTRPMSSMYDHQSSSDTSNNIEFIDHPSSLQEPLLNDSKEYQNDNSIIEQTRDDDSDDTKNETTRVFDKIQSPIISIFITFFITLTIFPSWTGSLTSTQQCQTGSSRLRNDLFTPFMVVLFNVFDLIGRTSSGYIMGRITRSNFHSINSNSEFDMFSMTSKKIMFLSTLRFIFLPAFYLCKNNPYKSDIYTVMVMVLFASSNGMASNLSFIHAATLLNANPQDSNDEAMQSVASTLLNFAVGLGLMSGSMFSFIYNYFGLKLA